MRLITSLINGIFIVLVAWTMLACNSKSLEVALNGSGGRPQGGTSPLKDMLGSSSGETYALIELLLILAEAPGSPNAAQAPLYFLSYVENGSGRTLLAAHNIATLQTLTTEVPGDVPVPQSLTVKGLVPSRQVFLFSDLPPNAIDVARDPLGQLVLQSDGSIRNTAGALIYLDPRLKSVSYAFGVYHLLRSDGSVWLTTGLSESIPQYKVPNLAVPTARRIAWGNGA